jgi:CRP-like cAMP-binding protein
MDVSIDFLLSETRLFKNLLPEEAQIICDMMKATDAPAGTVLCDEGSHAKAVWFVAMGELEVVKKDAKGNLNVIATIRQGASVGEMGIIDGLLRSATIRAKNAVTIVIFDRESFEKVMEKHPAIGCKILLELARNLSTALRKTTSDISALS